jgi:hypothetical protein
MVDEALRMEARRELARRELARRRGQQQETAPAPTAIDDPIEQKATALADYQEKIGRGESAGGLFSGGFALGLKDKVSGAANALTGLLPGSQPWNGETVGEDYKIGRRAQEILEERARSRSGALGAAAEIAGNVAGGALAKAPAAIGALPRIAQTAREAGILGTIMGAGDSRSESLGGVAGDAVMGGAIGAGLGGALGGALEVARPVIKGAVAGTRAVTGLGGNTEARAAKRVVQALSADDMTPGKAAARMATRGQSLVNIGDENVMGLGRAVSARPGPGRQTINKALDAGQAARPDRAIAAVQSTLGGADQPFNIRVASMVQQRGQQANRAYQAAFQRNYGANHAAIFDDLQRRVPGEAVRNAMRVAQAEGRPFGQQLIASIDDASGNVTFRRAPSIEEWHYIQRGLRSAMDSAYRSGAGEVGTAYRGLHRQLLDAMDSANPLYKAARRSYATQSQLLEALQRGREIMRPETLNNLDQLADDFTRMSKPEREMMRLGLSRGLEDAVSSTPSTAGDVVNRIFGTPQKRQAIRTLFESDSAFRQFEVQMRRLAKEASVFKNIRTGSRTAFVEAEKDTAGNLAEAAGNIMDVGTGNVAGPIRRGLSKMLGNLGNMDEQTAARVAEILISEDPQFVVRALASQTNRNANQQITNELLSRAFRIARGGAAVMGGAGGASIASGQ